MKTHTPKVLAAVLALAALLLVQAPAFAAKKMVPKVDNFVVLFDMSGSMAWDFADTDDAKAKLALADLKAMNDMIPELGYKSGLTSVASYKLYHGLAPYSRSAYAQSIQPLGVAVSEKTKLGPSTPLGDGMNDFFADFTALKGKTAVILFSDGGFNAGRDPIIAAENIHKKSGGNICFHTVSYADKESGQLLLEEIAAVGKCGYTTTHAAMTDSSKRAQFVKDVFYTEIEDDPDTDMDGVPDSRDKCPNTPRDHKVDANGCSIPLKMRLEILFDFDKSDIKPKYVPEVEKVANLLKTNPGATVSIEGHTDGRGTEAYNLKLSDRRAKAVEDYIEKKLGIDPARVTGQGFGKARPIASNDTDEGRALNRRVEAIFQGLYEKR